MFKAVVWFSVVARGETTWNLLFVLLSLMIYGQCELFLQLSRSYWCHF